MNRQNKTKFDLFILLFPNFNFKYTLSRVSHILDWDFPSNNTPLVLLSNLFLWWIVSHLEFFFLSIHMYHVLFSSLFFVCSISQVKPGLTHWTRQLSNQSSAEEVMRETERKGRTNHGGVRGEVRTQARFLLATDLPFSLSLCPPIHSSPVKPQVISSSVSSPTMITTSGGVWRNTQTSVTSFSTTPLFGLILGMIKQTKVWKNLKT